MYKKVRLKFGRKGSENKNKTFRELVLEKNKNKTFRELVLEKNKIKTFRELVLEIQMPQLENSWCVKSTDYRSTVILVIPCTEKTTTTVVKLPLFTVYEWYVTTV